jgi:hypothetical protein
MPTFLPTPIQLTPVSGGVWETHDLSAHIPAGAAGAHMVLAGDGSFDYTNCGIRPVGSTNGLLWQRAGVKHHYFVALNANREVQTYVSSGGRAWIVGYFSTDEAVFFTDAVSVAATAVDTWETKNINGSTGADPVLAVMGYNRGTGNTSPTNLGFRCTGETYTPIGTSGSATFIIPCDGSKQFDIYTANTAHTFMITGYIKTGFTANAPVDVSTNSTYGTKTAPARGAVAIQIDTNYAGGSGAIRPSSTYTTAAHGTGFGNAGLSGGIVQTTALRKFDTYCQSATPIMYRIGYFTDTITPDARYGRPTEDVAKGSWVPTSGSTLSPMLDETSADDADLVYTYSATSGEVVLSPITDPATSSGHSLRVRARSDQLPKNLRVTLLQDTTQIAQWTEALSDSWTTHFFPLSGAQIDAITDYGLLVVRIESL